MECSEPMRDGNLCSACCLNSPDGEADDGGDEELPVARHGGEAENGDAH